jgi:molybdopterin converting factor small subunit
VAAELRVLPGGLGVNALVARNQDRLVELPLANPDVVADLDTPEDLQRWGLSQTRNDRTNEDLRPVSLDRSGQSMNTMQVRVCLYALAKERVGRAEVVLDLPVGSTVADLRAALRDTWPELGAVWSRALIAVDQEYAGDDVALAPGSQLAVVPPVSGGVESQRDAPCTRPRIEESGHR